MKLFGTRYAHTSRYVERRRWSVALLQNMVPMQSECKLKQLRVCTFNHAQCEDVIFAREIFSPNPPLGLGGENVTAKILRELNLL